MKVSKVFLIFIAAFVNLCIIAALVMNPADVAVYLSVAIVFFVDCMVLVLLHRDKKFKALFVETGADHSLYDRNVVILQTEYIRMRVQRCAAGTFSFKIYYTLTVNVPPGNEAVSMADTIAAINGVSEALHKDGLLLSSQMGVKSDDDDDESVIQVYPLSLVVNGKISPKRFGEFYKALLKAIVDNGSNDCEKFTIMGTETGTIYRHYRGNLCVGTVECEDGHRLFLKCACDRFPYLLDDEREYDKKQYEAIRDSVYRDDETVPFEAIAKFLDKLLWKTRGMHYFIARKDMNSLRVSISGQRRSEQFQITKQDGLWWVYGYGNMINVPTLTTDSEAEAARMFLRIVMSVNSTFPKGK